MGHGRWSNETIPIGRDNANNITSTTNVVANIDGSVLERLEALLGNGSNPLFGTRVSRIKSDLMDGSTTIVFTVGTGEVLITALYGIIQDAAHAVVTDNCQFVTNPANGSATDLCATTDMTGKQRYSMLSIDGASGTALVTANAGSILSTERSVIVAPGTIDFVSSGNDTNATKVELNLWYFPLDNGATVVTA